MACQNQNDSCQNTNQCEKNNCGYIIIIVLYILLAIILGACIF